MNWPDYSKFFVCLRSLANRLQIIIYVALLSFRSSDKWKSDHATERVKFFGGQCKQTMCFWRVGCKWRSRLYLEGRMVSCDWVLFENTHRGSCNAQLRFPSRYISFEAIERFLVETMLKSLCFHCLRHYEGQLVSENEFIFRNWCRKSYWWATKENSVIKENVIFESRSSFCFCYPAKNPASHQARRTLAKLNWSQKT